MHRRSGRTNTKDKLDEGTGARIALLHQYPAAAVGEEDDEAHHSHHQVVMPAVGFLAPESNVPDKNLLLDGTEANEDEADGGKLSQDTEGYAEAAGQFGASQKDSETLAHANVFAAGCRFGGVAPAALHEDGGDHQPKQEKSEVGVLGKLRENVQSPVFPVNFAPTQ